MTSLVLALALALPPAAAPAAGKLVPVPASASTCGLCHPEQRVEHEASVHHAEAIDCVSCHGGVAAATEVAVAHGKGFHGSPSRKDTPALCAGCHADIARMRPYNLPTDQLALYRTSQHGRLLEKGDDRVAVCTDCHGVHGIRRHDDPESSVYFRNVPRTCARCHSDPALAARYGWKADPYQEYAAGVHGKALLEGGGSTAPECSRCHGAHGAAPTGFGDVDKICGQCHGTTRAAFLAGPHKEAMDQARLPECVSCHGHHRVEAFGPDQLEAVCARCHDAGSAPQATAGAIREVFRSSEEEISRARAAVTRAAAVPIFVHDYEARLDEARTLLLESQTVMHAVDLQLVRAQTERARAIAHEVESEVDEKLHDLVWRRVFLAGLWFYLALTIAILLRFRRRVGGEAQA